MHFQDPRCEMLLLLLSFSIFIRSISVCCINKHSINACLISLKLLRYGNGNDFPCTTIIHAYALRSIMLHSEATYIHLDFVAMSIICVCVFFLFDFLPVMTRANPFFLASNCYPMLYPIGYSLRLSIWCDGNVSAFKLSKSAERRKKPLLRIILLEIIAFYFAIVVEPDVSKHIPASQLDTTNKQLMMKNMNRKRFFSSFMCTRKFYCEPQ